MKADDDYMIDGLNSGITYFEYLQAKVKAQQEAIEQIQKILQYYNATVSEKTGADLNVGDRTWEIIQEDDD